MHELELLDRRLARGHAHERRQHAAPLEQLIDARQAARAARSGGRRASPARDRRGASSRCRAAGSARRRRSRCSAAHLVWKLVPALAVADAVPHAPLPRLRLALDPLPQSIRALDDASVRRVVERERARSARVSRSRFSLTVRHSPQSSAVRLAMKSPLIASSVGAADLVPVQERRDVVQILVVSSTTWSFVRSSSASGIVGSSSAMRRVIGIVWHISNAADEHVELPLVRARRGRAAGGSPCSALNSRAGS